MKQKLMNFLMDSFKDNTRQMIDIAIRDNASFLISKDIKELDKDVYKRIRAEKVVQKIFYNKVLNEIQLLISEFDKEKIKRNCSAPSIQR